ncbi:cytochrome c [Pseudomonas sp. S75]|uniref:c-type cytochrome n=1 Tax=unclassified Pseudomonas TaxID=196821 RepID=UPI001905B94D|nr:MULTISPECIES: cytochrome c [unclassified Pseudomonas]MBJ9975013.1 cytochrome c [Pseudomonas sp. S30]MBK0152850.1 cytochrome c [Pseudomonas sp. S75]
MRFRKGSVVLAILLCALAALLAAWLLAGWLNQVGDAQARMTEPVTPALIERGAYLARVGDCVACHTARGSDKAFAGGLGIASPIGTLYATNITPDKRTGIGNWTYGQFERALRRGVGHDGSALYPAMPYPSYAKVTDADTQALYAYFMQGVAPVEQANRNNGVPWPLSIRWPLAYWRALFAPAPAPEAASSSVEQSAVARGAYLVQGLGHCGSCHTPRAVTLQEKALDDSAALYLSGTELNGWNVPSLRRLPHWSEAQVIDYLGTGRNTQAAVAGEMTDVILHSTSHMSDTDLQAMAAYLKSLGSATASTQPAQAQAATQTQQRLTAAKDLSLGERLYLDNCNACHFVSGKGAEQVFPRLDGATVVNADNPRALVQVILQGASTPSTERAPSVLPMPGFAKRLNDQEVAELASFLRQGWSNSASKVSKEQVREIRRAIDAQH